MIGLSRRKGSGRRALRALAASMLERYSPKAFPAKREAKPPVILFVLGAAASFRSAMPAWNAIRDALIDAAKDRFHPDSLFIDEAWEQLAPYIGPGPPPSASPDAREKALRLTATTEQILGVACTTEVVRARVVQILTDEYIQPREKTRTRSSPGRRPNVLLGEAPQLGYELIAHFMRHGFIDHVVNFNFDEALDVALENELGRTGYRRILSDSDVVLEALTDQPEPIHHYLKLHGTISVPSSLRFTKDHTQTIPPGMLNTLDKIAFPKDGRPLHLVTLGYSWNDADFVNWVAARAERIKTVTIVRRDADHSVPPLLDARYADRRERSAKRDPEATRLRDLEEFVFTQATADITVDSTLDTSIDDVLWALANGIEKRLDEKRIAFVPIARHVILSHMFGPTAQHRDTKNEPIPWGFDYLNPHTADQRLKLELWLHLFKCSGMMTISGIAETPRIQRYIEALGDSPASVVGYLPGGVVAGPPLQVRETFFHSCQDAAEAYQSFKDARFLTFRLPDYIQIPTLDVSSGRIGRPESETEDDFLKRLVGEIWRADETEVTTTSDPRTKWLLPKTRPLDSFLSLREQTHKLLLTNWDYLLLIAESGAWLAHWLDKHPRQVRSSQQMLLIRVADDGLTGNDPESGGWGAWRNIKNEIEKQFQKPGRNVHQMTLPWWRHNRHLTLAVSAPDGGKASFCQGIYFRRRLKTSRIAPVAISATPDDQADCRELFLIFLAYALRAKELAAKKRGANTVEADASAAAFVETLCSLALRLEESWQDDRLSDLLKTLRAPTRPTFGTGAD